MSPINRPKGRVALLTLLFLALPLIWWQCRQETTHRIRAAQAMGRLAPLPISAHDIQTEVTGNFVSDQIWLRFAADHQQIDQFLHDSSGIAVKNVRTRLDPLPADTSSIRRMPEWFGAEQVNRGRYFLIPWDKHSNYGWVLVDDERNVVYLYVSHS